jgi:hypothetical protein
MHMKSLELNLVGPIGRQFLSPGTHSLRQILEHGLGIRPMDTSICDTHAVLEAGLALWRDLLIA